MYSWTLLARDVSATPYLMGVTDDLAKAQRLCEPHLESRRAFLGYVEAVQPAITVHSLDASYVRTGRAWLGRLESRGRVGWREQAGRARIPRGKRPVPGYLEEKPPGRGYLDRNRPHDR